MSKSQPKSIATAIPTLIGVTRDVLEAALKSLNAPGGKPIKTGDDFMELFAQVGAQSLFTPPAIGEYWAGQGGIYDGQVREEDGTIYHQIHADVKAAGRLDHAAAMKWASSLSIDGHSDFTLPTRRGLSLIFANLVDRFERTWYWSSEIYSASYAWGCYFSHGYQDCNSKSAHGAAVAVRRFKA